MLLHKVASFLRSLPESSSRWLRIRSHHLERHLVWFLLFLLRRRSEEHLRQLVILRALPPGIWSDSVLLLGRLASLDTGPRSLRCLLFLLLELRNNFLRPDPLHAIRLLLGLLVADGRPEDALDLLHLVAVLGGLLAAWLHLSDVVEDEVVVVRGRPEADEGL